MQEEVQNKIKVYVSTKALKPNKFNCDMEYDVFFFLMKIFIYNFLIKF